MRAGLGGRHTQAVTQLMKAASWRISRSRSDNSIVSYHEDRPCRTPPRRASAAAATGAEEEALTRHTADQSLQVQPFREGQSDRMVRSLGHIADDLSFSLRINRRTENDFLEQIGGDGA